MPETANSERSIETRLAAIEEKLAKIFITEEEMKAYLKVRALLGCETADPKPEPIVGSACQCETTQAVVRAINRDIINRFTRGDRESCGILVRYGSFVGSGI